MDVEPLKKKHKTNLHYISATYLYLFYQPSVFVGTFAFVPGTFAFVPVTLALAFVPGHGPTVPADSLPLALK